MFLWLLLFCLCYFYYYLGLVFLHSCIGVKPVTVIGFISATLNIILSHFQPPTLQIEKIFAILGCKDVGTLSMLTSCPQHVISSLPHSGHSASAYWPTECFSLKLLLLQYCLLKNLLQTQLLSQKEHFCKK